MTTLVLTNPKGYRVQRNLPRLQATLAQVGVEHCITRDLTELDAVLGARQWQPNDLVVVNGGDGSVQHYLTRLLAQRPIAAWPRLAILPAGTTNMTAYAFNRSRSYRRSLKTLNSALSGESIPCQERQLVQVSNGEGKQVGAFFGAAAIMRGIEYFHQQVKQRGEWGVGLLALRAAWAMARRQLTSTKIRLDQTDEYDALLLIVTSLDRLILGTRPYWGRQSGSLHLTLIEQRATHFLRYLPRFFSGRPGQSLRPENGYHSRNLDRLELRIDGSFTLDGEIFQVQESSIQLEAIGPLRVLPL